MNFEIDITKYFFDYIRVINIVHRLFNISAAARAFFEDTAIFYLDREVR